jgi:hypothetical protein
VAENQPVAFPNARSKTAMQQHNPFLAFDRRLREFIHGRAHSRFAGPGASVGQEKQFDELGKSLFALQFAHNAPYRRFCEARKVTPERLPHWSEIPAVPTAAFKELEFTSLLASGRTAVFHSSGTTGEKPSRHFHSVESLALYETSLLRWFAAHMLTASDKGLRMLSLTPPLSSAPHSSLVYMFETVRRQFGSRDSLLLGRVDPAGGWTLDFERVVAILRQTIAAQQPVALLGTGFSFVHLLDQMTQGRVHFILPAGSRVMETGGYKGRSRALARADLHALITERLGIAASHIVCEYGMCESSSQAYDQLISGSELRIAKAQRLFRFPPWVRVRIVSPETGREVGEGETGLIRIFDLANVYSVMALETADLGTRRADGFEMIGRDVLAEPRGCSLMPAGITTV